jgi:hypothetical protein
MGRRVYHSNGYGVLLKRPVPSTSASYRAGSAETSAAQVLCRPHSGRRPGGPGQVHTIKPSRGYAAGRAADPSHRDGSPGSAYGVK